MALPYALLQPTARALRRWVLGCFACVLLAGVLSPMVHPRVMELVCSSMGTIQLYVHTEDGPVEMGGTAMDCPLCHLPGAPPPPAAGAFLPHPLPLGHAVQSIPAARIAAATAGPLPARGPPAHGARA
ncbi:DUF2946 family protein [Paracidovorax konjaci]|uniref:DUF2946 domain-containing protein n=1 Tax=Paracidovorax konjaci TaxID=32040 RepID=A0A1I1SF68_9BURK|nr:hypothetical protein SAMN04489710_102177 [Paracidovorax konjaci]